MKIIINRDGRVAMGSENQHVSSFMGRRGDDVWKTTTLSFSVAARLWYYLCDRKRNIYYELQNNNDYEH